jgi:hypothetical protein
VCRSVDRVGSFARRIAVSADAILDLLAGTFDDRFSYLALFLFYHLFRRKQQSGVSIQRRRSANDLSGLDFQNGVCL